ncbi:MAG: hypothetical protein C0507_00555 [Cyanobacteria bacterium PR.3.49]|nr:hypothetical protein [Cyanobacteria bacterium PR.3.49]
MGWHWSKFNRVSLARYVLPEVSTFLSGPCAGNAKIKCIHNLEQSVLSYQQEPAGRLELLEIIYNSVLEKKIWYAPETYNPASALQTIRTPEEIFNGAPPSGTCLDLSILFCGLCLHYELLPFLVILDGHAFVAVSTKHGLRDWGNPRRKYLEDLYIEELKDFKKFKKLIDSNDFVPIECTGFSKIAPDVLDGNYPEAKNRTDGIFDFQQALASGREHCELEHRDFCYAIDIAVAQNYWRIAPDSEIYEQMKSPMKSSSTHLLKNAGLNIASVPSKMKELFVSTFQNTVLSRDHNEANRAALLRRIDQFWIQGFLQKAPLKELDFNLEKEIFVSSSFTYRQSEQTELLKGSDISEIFDQMGDRGRRLLIRGDAGSGKTITALNLCKRLLDEAKALPDAPIPILLRFGGTFKAESFGNWIVDKICTEYRVSPNFASSLIRSQKVTFILDGLDELSESEQESAIAALRMFGRTNGLLDIVVTSRPLSRFSDLVEMLGFQIELILRPIPVDRLLSCTEKNAKLSALNSALKTNPNLAEKLSNPLICSVVVSTCIADQHNNSLDYANSNSLDLVRNYLALLINSGGDKIATSKRYTTWLAEYFQRTNDREISLDLLQPNCLRNPFQQILYRFILILIVLCCVTPILIAVEDISIFIEPELSDVLEYLQISIFISGAPLLAGILLTKIRPNRRINMTLKNVALAITDLLFSKSFYLQILLVGALAVILAYSFLLFWSLLPNLQYFRYVEPQWFGAAFLLGASTWSLVLYCLRIFARSPLTMENRAISIWRSLKNATLISVISSLIVFCSMCLLIDWMSIIYASIQEDDPKNFLKRFDIIELMQVTGFISVFIWLISGAGAFFQYMALRATLFFTAGIGTDFRATLDKLVKVNILRQSGNSYFFLHDLYREASLPVKTGGSKY